MKRAKWWKMNMSKRWCLLLLWCVTLPGSGSLSKVDVQQKEKGEDASRRQKKPIRSKVMRLLKNVRVAFEDMVRTTSSAAAVATGGALTATLAATAMAAAAIEREVRTKDATDAKDAAEAQFKHQEKEAMRVQVIEAGHGMDEDLAGGQLLSASLQWLSSTAGLLGTGVRVAGDTTGGVAGSSIRLVGGAVRSLGGGLDALADTLLLDSSPAPTAPHLNDKPRIPSNKQTQHGPPSPSLDDFLDGTRLLARSSVKAMSTLVKGMGESIVLVGAATESVTSSTAQLTQHAIGLVQELSDSLSSVIQEHNHLHNSIPQTPNIHETTQNDQARLELETTQDNFILRYGSYQQDAFVEPENKNAEAQTTYETLLFILLQVRQTWISLQHDLHNVFIDATQEVAGVPSAAPELMAAIILCYLASLLCLWSGITKQQTCPCHHQHMQEETVLHRNENHIPQAYTPRRNNQKYKGSQPVMAHFTRKELARNLKGPQEGQDSNGCHVSNEPQGPTTEKMEPSPSSSIVASNLDLSKVRPFWKRFENGWILWDILKGLMQLCLRLFYILAWFLRLVGKLIIRVVFSKELVLLLIHGSIWLYISSLSQSRSREISRHAEADGYRSALASIGSRDGLPVMTETAAWINALLASMWRIPLRSAAANHDKKEDYQEGGKRSDILEYGGLEPYISSKIGEQLIYLLQQEQQQPDLSSNEYGQFTSNPFSPSSRPSDIAYVSLDSISMGSAPPIIKAVHLKGFRDQGRVLNLGLEADVILKDFLVVLDIRLSSLKHAIMPSTKLAIDAVDMKVSLDTFLIMTPVYPYVSLLNVSFVQPPPCRVRVTPLSESSGLRGVDLGSLPLISTWIQDAIKDALSTYVYPRYVSVDMVSLLTWEKNGFSNNLSCKATNSLTTTKAQPHQETLHNTKRRSNQKKKFDFCDLPYAGGATLNSLRTSTSSSPLSALHPVAASCEGKPDCESDAGQETKRLRIIRDKLYVANPISPRKNSEKEHDKIGKGIKLSAVPAVVAKSAAAPVSQEGRDFVRFLRTLAISSGAAFAVTAAMSHQFDPWDHHDGG